MCIRDSPITELMADAQRIVQLGNQAGEGWYLVGEMVDMIREGVPNIAVVQPFACLPNHVTGRGIFREIRRQFPQANVVSVDYDPGASQVNQLNRIKLMAATARDRNVSEERDAGQAVRPEPDEEIPTSPPTASRPDLNGKPVMELSVHL